MNQGALLKRLCHESGRSIVSIAADMDLPRVWLYELFKKETLPPGKIEAACRVLGVSPGAFYDNQVPSGVITVIVVDGMIGEIEQVDGHRVLSQQVVMVGENTDSRL